MIVLDAGILIAFHAEDDAHHDRADRFLVAHLGEPMAMSALNLAEVLVRPIELGSEHQIRRSIRDLHVTIDPVAEESALELARIRHETNGLRMPDCCVLLTAQRLLGSVATFDEHLRREAERMGIPALDI